MDIKIRLATEKDVDALETLYDDANDYLEATTNYPGWQKGVYPVRQVAVEGVRDGCLYVATQNGEIAGSIVLRHSHEPAYEGTIWQANLEDSEVFVIHTFVVNPKYLQHGIGKKMLGFAYEHALITGTRALRLDVYEKNYPAIKLYEKCGYQYVNTVSLGLEDIGLDWFKLYEKLL